MTINPNQGDGDDLDIEEQADENKANENKKDKASEGYSETKTDDEVKKLESQIKTYYQRLLFYSFLTKEKVASLDDILNTLERHDNQRIASNLYLDKVVLQKISEMMDPFKRSSLDYKIQNISMLASDERLTPLDRAMTSIKKFNRMSESEVITPSKMCDDMVALLPEEGLRKIVDNQDKFLDIASKSGEYAVSIYKRLTLELGYSHEDVKDTIYSIPTSSIAYEFTRRFYEILNLNVDNIASGFNAYDLIKSQDENGEVDYTKINDMLKQDIAFNEITLKDEIKVGENKVKFGAVIGNPPYQESIKGTSDKQIYNIFMEIGYRISDFAVFISPGKFLFNAGKTPKTWNKKMLNDEHVYIARYESDSKNMFPNEELSSSLVITVRDTKNRFEPIKKFYHDENVRSVVSKVVNHDNFSSIVSEIFLQTKFNLDALYKDYPRTKEKLKTEKRLITSILQTGYEFFVNKKIDDNMVKIYGNNKNGKLTSMFIDSKYVSLAGSNLSGWKVIIAATNGAAGNLGGQSVNIIGKPRIIENNTGFTQTFISIGNYQKEDEIECLEKYLRTKFARFLIGSLKATQRLNKEVFDNVPIQDFTSLSDIDWSKSIKEIDEQLFDKYGLSIEEREHIKSSIKDM